jgi:hypothetical protein
MALVRILKGRVSSGFGRSAVCPLFRRARPAVALRLSARKAIPNRLAVIATVTLDDEDGVPTIVSSAIELSAAQVPLPSQVPKPSRSSRVIFHTR